MSSTRDTAWYAAGEEVSARRLDDQGAVLFQSDRAIEKMVNATGLFLWQRLDGSRSIQALAEETAREFEGAPPKQVQEDVRSFLGELDREGFVQALKAPRAQAPGLTELPDVQDAPKSVDISLTGKCNLHCAYCFYHDEMSSRPDLPKEVWLTFFEELGRLAVRDTTLSGGEIFVRPDLWELIDGLIDNRLRYSINTNGTLISEKILAEFEKGKRRARLGSIQVSIDGSCSEVHDKSRGKGSFEKALKGLRLVKEAGFPVTVRVTVNRHNVDDLENVARLLLEDINIASLGTNDAMPMGAGCSNQATITLTPQQQLQAMKTLAELSARYNGRITATAGPLAKWRMYREMEHARATGEKTTRWAMGCLSACGGIFHKLGVHHDGVIVPCDMLAKLEMGNINKQSISHIWTNHPFLKDLKSRRGIPMEEVPGCEDCEWAPFCNGGCPGLAYEMTGSVNLANPHDCFRKFLKNNGIKSMVL
ncbi:MAG: SynChlorMet cassette radical SAM/SPASM protein ScmE [Desulfobacteraceae bacterium]|jgi:SynChlorMet cassette radical SAM/SPASM protein ScmE